MRSGYKIYTRGKMLNTSQVVVVCWATTCARCNHFIGDELQVLPSFRFIN